MMYRDGKAEEYTIITGVGVRLLNRRPQGALIIPRCGLAEAIAGQRIIAVARRVDDEGQSQSAGGRKAPLQTPRQPPNPREEKPFSPLAG